MKKTVLFTALCAILSIAAHAQDTVNNFYNKARPFGFWSDYERIILKPNILSISPLYFSENGFGFQFAYEKVIDKEGIIAYNLPLLMTFNQNSGNSGDRRNDPMVYFSPGLKFYPTTCHGETKFAIGPSLVVGAGKHTEYISTNIPYSPNQPGYYYTVYTSKRTSQFMVGAMANASLNFSYTDHIYMGIDFGGGFTYINYRGSESKGLTGLVQGGIKIGYRY